MNGRVEALYATIDSWALTLPRGYQRNGGVANWMDVRHVAMPLRQTIKHKNIKIISADRNNNDQSFKLY